jgi:hypothetical protein
MQIDKSGEVQHKGLIGGAKAWVKGNITGQKENEGAAEQSLITEVDDYSGPASKKLPGIGTCAKAGAALGGAVGGAGGMLYGYSKLKTDGKPEILPGTPVDIKKPVLIGQKDTVSAQGGGNYYHSIDPLIAEEKVGTIPGKPEVVYHSDDPVGQGVLGLVGGTIIGGVVGLITGVILKIVGAVGGRGEKNAPEQKPKADGTEETKKGRSVGGTLAVVGGAAAGAAGGLYLAEKTIAVKDAYAPTITYEAPVYKTELLGYTDMDVTNKRAEPYPSTPEWQGEAVYRDVPQMNPDGTVKTMTQTEKPLSGVSVPMIDRIAMAGLGGIAGALGGIAVNTIFRVIAGEGKAHK